MEAPHEECHKGVGGRQFVATEKSAARIPTLMEIDSMLFVRLRKTNARFQTRCCVYMCKKTIQCPGDARALWHAKVPPLQLQKRRHCQDAQKTDSRLALARLSHSLVSNLQVAIYHCGAIKGSFMKVQSSERRQRAAVEGGP